MVKSSVYNGEVVGFTAGVLFGKVISMVNLTFDNLESAEKYCDSMNEDSNKLVYFPVKLTSVANKYLPEPSFD
jgi:hypothetical protein